MPNSPDLIVTLVRHAHSAMQADMENPRIPPFIGGRQNEVKLSKLGERQARGLGHYLLREEFAPSRIYHSKAERAWRTYVLSNEIVRMRAIPVEDERLQELDQGEWTNQSRDLYKIHAEEMERQGNNIDNVSLTGAVGANGVWRVDKNLINQRTV